MLLQSIMVVFALMGIATVVVDMGFVRLSQVQMQSGVDTAALEGLRRDRATARTFATSTYFDPAGERLVGAGPELTLTGGRTDANGSQLLSVSADPVYRPVLALNPANLVHGDMVDGTYLGGDPSESSTYTRTDFDSTSAAKSAFLVRMRRTDGRNPLDTPDAAVSTGRSLPLLFGLATTLQSAPGSSYSVRTHGITVRATAISNGEPARRITRAQAAPFGLTLSFWAAMPDLTPQTLVVDGTGTLSASAVQVGLFLTGATNTIGQPIVSAGAAGAPTGSFYVPIYTTISGSQRVIGFGFVTVSSGGGQLQVTRTRNKMAADGASVHVAEGFTAGPSLRPLLDANAALDGALRAPALVR
ncbi:MAG: pilus assembly protein TadG-related protein [Acidobacteria bacterium]|nr:pilus assembly protein TadG-related protein [Acidobacteriota bacterium]